MTTRDASFTLVDSSVGAVDIPPGADVIVDFLRSRGRPVTRQNYLRLAYPAGQPIGWTLEQEARLPPPLRLPPWRQAS